MRRRTKIIIAVLLAVTVVLVSFLVWAETPLGPMPQALAALKSDSAVTVSMGSWLVFTPVNFTSKVGFIIYPGGHVDYRSYAPEAHAIAAEGYLAVIAPMELNLAIFSENAATGIINSYPQVKTWAIGGHSLGGVIAAQYCHDNPGKVQGLMLWAAYPESGTDLSKGNLIVTTIHGTLDGVVSESQIQNSLKQLPSNTVKVEIVGGDHGQFGWYGNQPGDNPATISRDLQQAEIVNATVQLLQNL
ncbi:MAG TPA: alpha/beta hydrolase [Candidatus Nanoarchaeia archaeon]|nr:alpha/beta hydrolase [Candidatus Nanoarchaeia archaeon]